MGDRGVCDPVHATTMMIVMFPGGAPQPNQVVSSVPRFVVFGCLFFSKCHVGGVPPPVGSCIFLVSLPLLPDLVSSGGFGLVNRCCRVVLVSSWRKRCCAFLWVQILR